MTLQNGGTHWYDNYVNYAVANSLIEAAYQSKSAEDMNKAVTRAEFVHILAKLLNAGRINTVNNRSPGMPMRMRSSRSTARAF